MVPKAASKASAKSIGAPPVPGAPIESAVNAQAHRVPAIVVGAEGEAAAIKAGMQPVASAVPQKITLISEEASGDEPSMNQVSAFIYIYTELRCCTVEAEQP